MPWATPGAHLAIAVRFPAGRATDGTQISPPTSRISIAPVSDYRKWIFIVLVSKVIYVAIASFNKYGKNGSDSEWCGSAILQETAVSRPNWIFTGTTTAGNLRTFLPY
jgi:hypothetical protein